MSTLIRNPRSFVMRQINTTVGNLICATILASFILCGVAKAQETYPHQALLNPGAESALTNWNLSLTGYQFAPGTNNLIAGAGSGNILAHSGARVFELFDTTGDSSYMYQDYPAAPGSVWSGSCYAICYASNYFSTANFFCQVSFYNATNGLLSASNAVNTSQGNVYTSDFLDAGAPPESYIIVPPMAVDATGWLDLLVTNIFDNDPAQEANPDIYSGFNPTNLYAPPGTAKVRFMLVYTNQATGGGAVYVDDCSLLETVGTDPDIGANPVAVTVPAGSVASFTVIAYNAHKGETLSYQWQKNGTNLPAAGGVYDIVGNTTGAFLSFSNVQVTDSDLYDCVVTDTGGSIRSVPVPLTVQLISPLTKVNKLGNAGFENNPVFSPWSIFNGCYFQTTNNYYDGANSNAPVNVYDGNSVCEVGANGDRDNGLYQIIPATPGSVWKAGAYAYISSSNDFNGGNTCRIQCWFKDASAIPQTVLGTPTFESFKIYGWGYTNTDAQYTNIDTSSPNDGVYGYHTFLPRGQWVVLPVTNVVNDGNLGLEDDLPYNTFPSGDFQVPTNSTVANINYQIYEYNPVAADNPQADLTSGGDTEAVYFDDAYLIQVVQPTGFTATRSGNNVNLAFTGQAGLNFVVQYKTNLTDAAWNVLTNVAPPLSWQTNVNSVGITYPMTVSDTIGTAHSRFYRIQAE